MVKLMEELSYEVDACLAVWPHDLKMILSTLRFELDGDGSGVRRLGRPRTRSTAELVDPDSTDLDESSALALALARVNEAFTQARTVLSNIDSSLHQLEQSVMLQLRVSWRQVKVAADLLDSGRYTLPPAVVKFQADVLSAVSEWEVRLLRIQKPRAPKEILGARSAGDVIAPRAKVKKFLEVFDVPSAFLLQDFTDESRKNPTLTPAQLKQLDALRSFDSNVDPPLARSLILAYNRLGKQFAAQQYKIGHIYTFMSTMQLKVLLLSWHCLEQRPAGIELSTDVYDLKPADAELLLYSRIVHITEDEQATLQQTAIEQIETLVLSHSVDKIWQGTCGATAFFGQFEIILQGLGFDSLIRDFPATEKAYVELLASFLPLDGRRAIAALSISVDKEVLRKLDHFTPAVHKWYDTVRAYQLQLQAAKSAPESVLRRLAKKAHDFPPLCGAAQGGHRAARVLQADVSTPPRSTSENGPTKKCCGCGGDHWFMEVAGDKANGRYRITCDKRYAPKVFLRHRASAYKHLFGKPYRPITDMRQALRDMPKKIRKRIALSLMEYANAEDDGSGSDGETDRAEVTDEGTDASDCYSLLSEDLTPCSATVHVVKVRVQTASVRPAIKTHVLLGETPYLIKNILYDSGAQLSLFGNAFLLEMVANGAFPSLAAAVEKLRCAKVDVLVHGVSDGDSGTGLTARKYMELDFAITLNGASPASPSTRLTVEGVHAYYHPDFPTVLGDDVLLVTNLTPEHHIAPLVGQRFRALQPFSGSKTNQRVTNLAVLENGMPSLETVPKPAHDAPTEPPSAYSSSYWLTELR